MPTLEETKTKRFQYLNKLHDITGGSSHNFVNMREVGQELGFPSGDTDNIVEYLVGEHLVKHVAMGGEIAITHQGRKEIERALSAPEQPTTYFPPAVNILHVENMVGSQIQQGTHHSTQNVSVTQNHLDAVSDLLKAVKARASEVALGQEAASEMQADIATAEAQVSSSRPKHGIIIESLRSIRTILEGAAGSIAATELLPQVQHVIHMLAQ